VTRWIGRAVLAIGALHTAVGLVMFRRTLAELVADGIVNTVHGQPVREFAFWFLFFGLLAMLLGALIDWCEQEPRPLPAFLGLSLLALFVACVTIMPASGGWLIAVPAWGALRQARGTAARPVRV
jgi:hypothetical protein